jgi:hypothetical protein
MSKKYGQLAYTQPTRQEYKHTLWMLAAMIRQIRTEFPEVLQLF